MVRVRFLRDWILIEFCMSFFMIKYSKFTNNIESGNFTDTFYQNGNKFKNSVAEGVLVTPPHTPLLNTPLGGDHLACYVLVLQGVWWETTVIYLRLKVLCYLQSGKIEPLFYKINTCSQKNTTYSGLQAEQIISVNI